MTDEQKYNYCLQLIRTVDGIRTVDDIVKACEDYINEHTPRYEKAAIMLLNEIVDGLKRVKKSFNTFNN